MDIMNYYNQFKSERYINENYNQPMDEISILNQVPQIDEGNMLEIDGSWNFTNNEITCLSDTTNPDYLCTGDFSQIYLNAYNQLQDRYIKVENNESEIGNFQENSMQDMDMPWLIGYRVEDIWNGCLMSSEIENDNGKSDKNKRKKYKQNKGTAIVDNEDINNNEQNIPERARESNPLAKPPYTYTELIELALEDKGKMTVSGIYKWIAARYPYFKLDSDRWKNSVRHNLSINPQFRKQGKKGSGAGHLWSKVTSEEIANQDHLNENIRNILRSSESQISKQNAKKAKIRNRVKEKRKKDQKQRNDCEPSCSYKTERNESDNSNQDELMFETEIESVEFNSEMIEEEVITDFMSSDYFDNIQLLDTSDNTSQLLIEEQFRIKTEAPSYNYNVDSSLYEIPNIDMQFQGDIFEP